MASAFDEARVALYAVPPEEFVAKRKELAARLKAAGDSGGARLLGALPKPTPAAWAVNQLHRQGALGPVMGAGHAHRVAQARMAAGQLDVRAAREAQDTHRHVVSQAARVARALMVQGGLGATDAAEAKVVSALQAISLRGSFSPYAEGCLAGDVEPPSLDEMLDGLSDREGPAVAPPAVIAPDPAELARRAADERAAEERRAREADRAAARVSVERQEGRLRDASDALSVSRHRLERLRAAADEAERALAKAHEALAVAEANEAIAREEVGIATAAAESARNALAALG